MPIRISKVRLSTLSEGAPPKRRSKCNEAVQRMRRKFDTPFGRELYSRRMGTVEPVFANIQNKGMRRFTLRGQKKVSAQFRLHVAVFNANIAVLKRGA